MREYKLYLADILAAMESIERFIGTMSFEEFQADDKTAEEMKILFFETQQVPT